MKFLMKTNKKKFDYFMESDTDDIEAAIEEFDGDYDDEELRLYRIKFFSVKLIC